MIKIFISAIIALSLFSHIILRSSDVTADESVATPRQVDSTGDKPEGGPPSLTRNPFVSAPYGRMVITTGKSDANPGIKKRDGSSQGQNRTEGMKDLKIKGILVGRDYPVALIGRRIVKIGDKIDEFTITEITRTGITLSKDDMVVQLSIE